MLCGKRSHSDERPVTTAREEPCSLELENVLKEQQDPAQMETNKLS